MTLRAAGAVMLVFIVTGCGDHGATQFAGPAANPVQEFGQCAFCHGPMAANMVVTAQELKCQICHADERPGTVGPGHRAMPGMDLVPSRFPDPTHLLHAEASFGSCAFCHNQFAANMVPVSVDLNCPICHDNLLPDIYSRGHRSLPGPDRVPSFAGPMHTLGAEASFGSCAFCHNQFAHNMEPVSADLNCPVCHDNLLPGTYGPDHESRPGPERVPSSPDPAHTVGAEARFGSCAFCHNDVGHNLLATTMELACETCHADRQPGVYGPGHRALPSAEQVPSFPGPAHATGAQAVFGSCALCHNNLATTLTPLSAMVNCTTCHSDRQPGMFGPGHESIPGPEQVPSFPGPAHATGAQAVFGSCALCHNNLATTLTPLSAMVNCTTCHSDRQPGMFGPGHESIPGPEQVPSFPGPAHATGAQAVFGSCALCHNNLATTLTPLSAMVNCTTCHSDRQPGMFGPGHESIPGPEQVPSFPGPAHATGAQAVFGSCALCHNNLATTLTPLSAMVNCTTCHSDRQPGMFGPGHESIPGPEQVPSFPGPAHATGAQAVFGSCALCHNNLATTLTPLSATLNCGTCHSDRQPGMFGPGHESIPGPEQVPSFPGPAHDTGAQGVFGSCALCHNNLATTLTPVGAMVKCTTCHTDRQPGMFGPEHESIPGPEQVPSFPGPAHATGAQAVFGSCALCHNNLAITLTPYSAMLKCVTCHDDRQPGMFGPGHESIPGPERVPSSPGPSHALGPEARFGECGFCHNQLTLKANTANMHGTLSLECATCHEVLRPGEHGPGHQLVPRCANCHSGPQTHHDPAAGGERECAVCHEPHGSTNLFLVGERILTPSGPRAVQFTNEGGVADGGFVNESNRGSGICETCHTTTRYFRSDGTGAPHFSVTCVDCHTHPAGFASPPPSTVTPTRTPTPRPTSRLTSTATPTPTATPTSASETAAPTP